MEASWLSSVATLGAETVLTVPLLSAAVRRRFNWNAPPALPKMKPRPPPDPGPTAAGRLTAKLGFAAVPAFGCPPAAPLTRAVEGNTKPVVLPSTGAQPP